MIMPLSREYYTTPVRASILRGGSSGAGMGKFQGDEAAEIGVFGFVDDAHPSALEFFEEAVAGVFFTEPGCAL